MTSERNLRLSDFERRIRNDPDAVFQDAVLGSYVSVHPMADEGELLERLGIAPNLCTKVDCYWKDKDKNDVYFLQVETRNHAGRDPGLWARLSPGKPPYINLLAVVENDAVTRNDVHVTMHMFKKYDVGCMHLNEYLQHIGNSGDSMPD